MNYSEIIYNFETKKVPVRSYSIGSASQREIVLKRAVDSLDFLVNYTGINDYPLDKIGMVNSRILL